MQAQISKKVAVGAKLKNIKGHFSWTINGLPELSVNEFELDKNMPECPTLVPQCEKNQCIRELLFPNTQKEYDGESFSPQSDASPASSEDESPSNYNDIPSVACEPQPQIQESWNSDKPPSPPVSSIDSSKRDIALVKDSVEGLKMESGVSQCIIKEEQNDKSPKYQKTVTSFSSVGTQAEHQQIPQKRSNSLKAQAVISGRRSCTVRSACDPSAMSVENVALHGRPQSVQTDVIQGGTQGVQTDALHVIAESVQTAPSVIQAGVQTDDYSTVEPLPNGLSSDWLINSSLITPLSHENNNIQYVNYTVTKCLHGESRTESVKHNVMTTSETKHSDESNSRKLSTASTRLVRVPFYEVTCDESGKTALMDEYQLFRSIALPILSIQKINKGYCDVESGEMDRYKNKLKDASDSDRPKKNSKMSKIVKGCAGQKTNRLDLHCKRPKVLSLSPKQLTKTRKNMRSSSESKGSDEDSTQIVDEVYSPPKRAISRQKH
eukprot:GHVL01044554.1.p1 GENE.GHVL01044554.1~~GHVL01044554.1.p1  ORF type:complete len:493 (-),score=78.00 GHVL01044554.1:1232-2710(-)